MRCAIWFVQAVAGGYCRSISGTGARSTGWFRELARRFLFQTIHDVELMPDREQAGRDASPTAGRRWGSDLDDV